MEITDKDIEHLAQLSRLTFSESELSSFKGQFQSIINYVNQLQSVDTNNVKDFTIIKTLDELRIDESRESLSNELVTMNAKNKSKGAFKVPTVVE